MGNELTYVETESFTHRGGTATLVNAASGVIGGAAGLSSTENIAISNAGTIGGGVSGTSSGGDMVLISISRSDDFLPAGYMELNTI